MQAVRWYQVSSYFWQWHYKNMKGTLLAHMENILLSTLTEEIMSYKKNPHSQKVKTEHVKHKKEISKHPDPERSFPKAPKNVLAEEPNCKGKVSFMEIHRYEQRRPEMGRIALSFLVSLSFASIFLTAHFFFSRWWCFICNELKI